MAAPSADRINARAAKDRAFLKRALKDPGLRSKLDPKYLSSTQQKSRALNTRLNAPITPGSSTTERDLAHAAQAATSVQFGPQEQALGQQLGVAQQTQRDTGSFYNEYKAALEQHAQNVQAFQAGAQQALAGTAQGITGLAGQDATQLQGMANAQAAQQGVAPAGDMTQLQNQAAATRQALIGSFQGQQALQGANANAYADTQANVVAPGQKLSALAQAAGRTRDIGKQIGNLKTQEGAFNEQFRDTRRQDEFKNVLAASTLNANVAQDQAQAATAATNAKTAQTRVTETTRHNRTAEGIAKTRNKNAAVTAQQKADLAAGKVNQYGYTDAAWRAMSTGQRQKVIKDFKASSRSGSTDAATRDAKAFYAKYGVKPVATGQLNTAKSSISQAQTWIHNVLASNPNMPLNQVGQLLTTGQPKTKDGVAIPKQNALFVRVAMDIKQYGGVTPGTADRLHRAGYSVAKLRLKPGRKPTPYKPPSSGPAAQIPGVGGN